MAAKQSAEMRAARALVEAGQTPYAAARACGITKQAIYMSAWYKERKQCVTPGNTATK